VDHAIDTTVMAPPLRRAVHARVLCMTIIGALSGVLEPKVLTVRCTDKQS
jgi:hypothetical protein